ncbi:MAG TPA: hypothetical protein PK095_04395, partial [Myxococcota bacterium]|nr:hypothetical protein [Myxococcota bacterium]
LSCPLGARATDTNADQCPDSCLCASGREAPLSGCECEMPLQCPLGQTAVDRDGDGCPDECTWACRTACDCDAD